jgi:hypothetical protein
VGGWGGNLGGWCAGWFGASVCGGLGAGAGGVFRGLGRAFLYLSISSISAQSSRQIDKQVRMLYVGRLPKYRLDACVLSTRNLSIYLSIRTDAHGPE